MNIMDCPDMELSEMMPGEIARLSEVISKTFGVTLSSNGGVFTFTHTASRAFVQKGHTLTFYGAWRMAGHIAKHAADPAAARNEPEHVDRYAHARRAEQRRKF